MYQMYDAEYQVKQQRHRVPTEHRFPPFFLPQGTEKHDWYIHVQFDGAPT